MKCESCTKYDDCRTGSGLTWPCGAYHPKTVTNADLIRAMSGEELANFLCNIMTAECCDRTCPGREFCEAGHKGLQDWLQQPEKED